jgi:hypothetical protein
MLASSTPLRGAVSKEIQNHQDLLVYRKAFDAAMSIFELSRSFPKEETYSLAEGEAAEPQVWLEFAVKCGYLKRAEVATLYKTYAAIIGTFVGMITHSETWIIQKK